MNPSIGAASAPSLLALAPDVLGEGGLATYAWAFGQGVLVDLTPCVYPLIPITVAVFGAKGVSRGRALYLASAYVLGMAVLYTSLGIAVAMTGAAFGTWLGQPVVVLPIVALLLTLSASMFGAFDLQLPTSIQSRLGTVGGAGPWGALVMGLVSGLISAPCTGPVLLSLLAYIARASADGHGVIYGGSLLFVYALGMGTLFFAVALGASLFRPGAWMEHVKSVFGIALLVMAVWFMRPLHPAIEGFVLDPAWGLWAGLGAMAVGLGAGAVHRSFHGPTSERVRKGVAVAMTTVGAVLVLNNMLYVPPNAAWQQVSTMAELEAALARADERDRPVLVDFWATWCLPCKELELGTFHDPRVEPELARRFDLIKVDVTDPDEEQERMKGAFSAETLPAVVLYPGDAGLGSKLDDLRAGRPLPKAAYRIDGVAVHADEFLEALARVR